MSFRSDKINKHAMLTKVAHKYSGMQKNTLCQKTLKDEALKMQQYIRTSLKGVSTKWFLCRGKGIEQIG